MRRAMPGSMDRKMDIDEIRRSCELILGWLLVQREESDGGMIPNYEFLRIATQGTRGMGKGDLEMALMIMAQLAEGMLSFVTSWDEIAQEYSPRQIYTKAIVNAELTRNLLDGDDDDDDEGSLL